jgi:hypothetical protein
VAGALADRFEDLRQALGLAAPHQLRAGMRERGQRGQGIVQFMADDADDLLPGLHFLAPQLGGQLAQQQQFVAAAVQAEVAARQVIHLFVLAFAGGEQAVAAAPQGLDQGRRRLFQHLVQGMSFQLAAFRQQLARGQVGVGDGARRIGQFRHQQHGHRRVLHHGVEQQLALHEVEALFAQHLRRGRCGRRSGRTARRSGPSAG